MLKPFLLIYCVVIISPIIYTADYCKICKNKSHTMCKYKKGPAKSCVHYDSIAMAPKLQAKIENLHNELRNKVALGQETRGEPGPQPSAKNIFLLKWEPELSKIAQRWADQCRSVTETNQHDECKDTERYKVGQNVMQVIRGSKPLEFETVIMQIIQHWYNEIDRLQPGQIKKFKGANDPKEEVGHYTQLVWATTKFLGCAHATFSENITQQGTTAESQVDTFVCNYGPTGNIVDGSIYKVGKPCLTCNCSVTFPGLCEHISNRPSLLTDIETKKETKTETKREAKLETNTESSTESNANVTVSQLESSAAEPTKQSSELVSDTAYEACTPETGNPHHNHHHRKGERCPFESIRTKFRLLHRDGDECYCLFRIRDSARKLLPETYLLYWFCLILYYFWF